MFIAVARFLCCCGRFGGDVMPLQMRAPTAESVG